VSDFTSQRGLNLKLNQPIMYIRLEEVLKNLLLFLVCFSAIASQKNYPVFRESKKSIDINLSSEKVLSLKKSKWTSFKLNSLRPKNTPINIALQEVPGVIFQLTRVNTLDKKLKEHCKKINLTYKCKKTTINKDNGIVEDMFVLSGGPSELGTFYYLSLKYNKKDVKNKELKKVLEVLHAKN
jgi:hypothetical protein